jgi:hypothetical protein
VATEITKILDPAGGGDYGKFSVAKTAFYGGTDGDLVGNDENLLMLVRGGGNANPDGYAHINNLTSSDATRRLTIRGAPGYKHNGRYNAESMAGIARFDTLFDASLLLSETFIKLQDILVLQRSNGGGGVSTLYLNGNDVLVERCMAVNHPTGVPTNETYGIATNITGGLVVRNSVVITLPSVTGHNHTPYSFYQGAQALTGEIVLDNCTFIMLGFGVVTQTSTGIVVRAQDDIILRNSVVWGAVTPIQNKGLLHSSSANNAYVGASGTGDVDLTGASAYDLFIDPDNYDFRPRRDSVLRAAGTDLSTEFGDDILGFSRPADGKYDIGAFQYQEGDGDVRARKRFILILPPNVPTVDGVKSMVVESDTPEGAKERANAEFDQDAPWTTAEINEIDEGEVYAGAEFKIKIKDLLNVAYTAVTGDGITEVGNGLVALLNAHWSISTADYNSTTKLLTVAGAAEGLGDREVEVTVRPDGARRVLTGVNTPVGTITDQGAAGAALTVQLRDSGISKILLRS